MATVCLLGTLDTKYEEYSWLKGRIEATGAATYLVDVGGFSRGSQLADVEAAEVAAAAGADLEELRVRNDRGEMMEAMASGAAVVVRGLFDEGRIDALLAVGGSSGSAVAGRAMQALPVGVPKLLVSTMASGDVSPYVGEVDATLMYSVVDIAGINSISEAVLGNAAAAAAAMATNYESTRATSPAEGRKLIGISMFGVTTPAADEARAELTGLGYEVLVFHATGSGGRALEKLAESGLFAGVLDLTTTELADELVGGVLTAGPDRLQAAGHAGVPQVVSVGALDMVNFGPRDTVPAALEGRNFFIHNPSVTLMRTTAAEMATLGKLLAEKLRVAKGPVEVFLPLRGVSAIDVEGGPFRDAAADGDLFRNIAQGLDGSEVRIHSLDLAINDPGFGRSMAQALHRLITAEENGQDLQ